MRKQFELKSPRSCLNKASDNEPLFVLLGRDPAAPAAIRAWVQLRILMRKNVFADKQIQEALDMADLMERER